MPLVIQKARGKNKGGTHEIAPTITGNSYQDNNHLIAKTVRAGGRGSPHGSKQNWDTYETEYGIRRLTPKECERLQAYPDDWTSIGIEIGKHGAEYTAHIISDRQRYKVLGNGVTTNVVAAIMERMVNGETKGR